MIQSLFNQAKEFLAANAEQNPVDVLDTGMEGALLGPDAAATIGTSEFRRNQNRVGLSREEIQEFKIAFSLCAEGQDSQDSLHKNKLQELFMTLGYTLGETVAQKILMDFPPDPDGQMSFDLLQDAYDHWLSEDIRPEEDVKSIFRALADPEGMGPNSAKRVGNQSGGLLFLGSANQGRARSNRRLTGMNIPIVTSIDSLTVKHLLRQVCHDPTITEEESKAVISEVDRTGSGFIDEQDFALMLHLRR
mmetsp:Transcript_34610/g.35294  ORF Transcript_34610/g.35294 Transcript_34610/m.35294 type:complete len:248 (+) Transcript_34610:96-839(+)